MTRLGSQSFSKGENQLKMRRTQQGNSIDNLESMFKNKNVGLNKKSKIGF